MKKISKENKLIDVMVKLLKSATSIKKEIFINNEYNIIIGTPYKGSEKESNKLLRFKQRFKFAYCYAIESMGR